MIDVENRYTCNPCRDVESGISMYSKQVTNDNERKESKIIRQRTLSVKQKMTVLAIGFVGKLYELLKLMAITKTLR